MHVWSVLSQKGGSGKTTAVLNLAIAAVRKGLVTSVLDLDPQKSAERWSDLRGERTGKAEPVIVHGTADSLKQMIETARTCGTDLVLIDTPPSVDRTMLYAAALGDQIVVPTRSSVLDQNALADTLDYLAAAQAIGKAVVLLNAATEGRDGGTAEIRAIAAGYDVAVVTTALADNRAFSVTLAKGRAAVETSPNSKAARSVEAVFRYLAARQRKLTGGSVKAAGKPATTTRRQG